MTKKNHKYLVVYFFLYICLELRKIVAIFLLLQIISSNAFAEELIKMPRLVTHYIHHAQEHADSGNFYDFLHKHYSDHDHKDTHANGKHAEDKDCNLPFKHCGSCCFNLHISVIGFVANYLHTDAVVYQFTESTFPKANDRIESLDLCTIWQPPKIS